MFATGEWIIDDIDHILSIFFCYSNLSYVDFSILIVIVGLKEATLQLSQHRI